MRLIGAAWRLYSHVDSMLPVCRRAILIFSSEHGSHLHRSGMGQRSVRVWQTYSAGQFAEVRVRPDAIEARQDLQTEKEPVVLTQSGVEPVEGFFPVPRPPA